MPGDDRFNIQFVLLSAPTDAQLEICARDLLEFLGALPDDPRFTLENIAYTLQVGREAYEKRLVVPAASIAALGSRLGEFLSGSHDQVRYAAAAKSSREDHNQDHHRQQSAAALTEGDTEALVRLWLRGTAIDWHKLKRPKQCCRIGLPGHPFRLRRYWITESRGLQTPQPNPAEPKTDPVPALAAAGPSGIRQQGEDGMMTPQDGTSNSNMQSETRKVTLSRLIPNTAGTPSSDPVVTSGPQGSAPESPGKAATDPVAAGSGLQTTDALCDALKDSLAKALFLEIEDIDVDQTFVDMGVDSLVGIDWIRSLNKTYDVAIRVTKIYDFPTLNSFTEFLAQEIASGSGQVIEHFEAEQSPGRAAQTDTVPEAHPQSILDRLVSDVAACMPDGSGMHVDIDKHWRDLGFGDQLQHSLMDRLHRTYGIALSPTDFIHFPTVREFAKLVEGQAAHAKPVSETKAAPASDAIDQIAQTNDGEETLDVQYGLVVSTVSQVDEVRLQNWPATPPGPREILIEVQASAINFPDVMCINGLYPTMPDYPFVPGFEVAGTVVGIGAKVKEHRIGDEIIAMTDKVMGGHARFVNVPSGNAVRKPKNLSYEEACSLPVCFSTVWSAFESGRLDDGESVLVHTATGGCGLVALQLAALKHCDCIATSSKDRKRHILQSLGIEHVLDYRTAFDEEIRQVTGGRGVDVVLNMISGEALQRGLNSLAPSGRYVELAVHALRTSAPLDLTSLVDNQSFVSLDMRRLGARPGGTGPAPLLEKMVEMIEADEISPIISRIYPRSQIRDALQFVASGNHVGKIVVSHTATEMTDCEEACLERVRQQRRRALSRPTVAATDAAEPIRAIAGNTGRDSVLEPIAIVGMSGQFPKAPNLAAFWDNLEQGVDCIGGIPTHRWADTYNGIEEATGTPLYPHMGVLEEADHFAASFFNISPKEARLMDPQQRIFLQDAWSCIEDAGYAPTALGDLRCGVFVGCSSSDYATQFKGNPSVHMLMGNASSILAARISYLLDLKGPCLAIDTGCSSSLVAISDACSSLATGACDMALAGGVNVASSPWLNAMLGDAGMLSADGRCFTFDRRANGFVPGEGVGTVLLKRLSDAERDGDHINAVISGWGINHDGKTNGMTAPSGKSQTALECDVYERFGIDASTISYVEAHGTGTSLGDPIEVDALVETFKSHTDRKRFCALGSVKSNIGHTICAAGVASVLKVALSMRHNALPPTVNFESLNEEISLDGTPFYVNDSLQHWAGPRRAAVSSFSYNGTNAHLVMDQYTAPTVEDIALSVPVPILLSARNPGQLDRQVTRLLAWVESWTERTPSGAYEAPEIDNIAYTLQVGRDHMGERLGFLARSREEIAYGLRAFITSPHTVPEGMFRTSVDISGRRQAPGRQQATGGDIVVPASPQTPDWRALLADWAAGELVDWAGIHQSTGRQRVPMPTYPFEKKQYAPVEHENADAPHRDRGDVAESVAGDTETRFKALMSRIDHSKANGIAKGMYVTSG